MGANSNQNGHDELVVTMTHLNIRSTHAHRSYNPRSPDPGRSEQCLGNDPVGNSPLLRRDQKNNPPRESW